MGSDVGEALRLALDDRYRVERILGVGGMATVFLAHDRRHERPVAIKVLQPDLAAQIGADRFAREIRLLAKLRHPFILPLFDSGAAGNLLYYTMAFIDGESLGARVARLGRLDPTTALEIAAQIADALGYAHSEGVVHRDVKPENILLTRQGHALLADFGIARPSLPDADRRDQVTALGLAIGTPAYMSPEQVLGEEVDGTSDIYSLGATLYHMLAGRPPFLADSPAQLASRHLSAEPAGFAALGLAVPPHVEAAALRALAKDPDDRFHTASEFARALREPVALTTVTTTPPRNATTTGTLSIPPVRKPTSLVVLPLTNLSGDQESEYLSDGLTDELIGALARVDGFRVISRTSAYAFKGKTVPMREIGEALKVSFAVEGGVRRSGDRLRVSAQLVRISDDSSLWSERYERPMADVFDVQDDISRRIVSTLTRTLRGATTPRDPVLKPRSPAAYDDYLLGRFNWNKRTKSALEQALALFERAIEIDPDFAPAYSGLADTLGIMVSSWFLGNEVYQRAGRAARRAVELDPNLPEAYASLGYLKLHADWDWAGAEADLRRAAALNPSYVPARQWLSTFLAATGRADEAVALANQIVELDPLSALARINLGTVYLTGLRYPEAEQEFRRAVSMEPNFEPAHTWLAICLSFVGQAEEAVALARRAATLSESRPAAENNIAFVLAMVGRPEEAETILQRVRPLLTRYPLFIAMGYAVLGQEAEMFEYLDRAVEARSHWMYSLGGQPTFRRYHQHPRFIALLERLGLPRSGPPAP